MAFLQASDLKKTFNGTVMVLDGISLSIERGDFVSVLGASGSGKSTLLTILGGMDKPDSGSVQLEGIELTELKEKELAKLRRTRLGFVFQFFNLAPYLTVEENIFLPIILNGKSIGEYKERCEELLSYFRLNDHRYKMPGKLSGGEQQRVAIARSLIYSPEVIFLDEPTGNLDSKTAREIMELLRDINETRSTTVIQVTHSERNASFGNKIIRISDGNIIEETVLKERKSEPKTIEPEAQNHENIEFDPAEDAAESSDA